MDSRDGLSALPNALLWLPFAAIIAAFVIANGIVTRSSSSVAGMSESIMQNAAPSIEQLALIRRSILEVELALSEVLESPAGDAPAREAFDQSIERAQASVAAYLSSPAYSNEEAPRAGIAAAWWDFENSARESERLFSAGNVTEARRVLGTRVQSAARLTLEHVTQAIAANAAHGRELAASIRATRRQTVRLSVALTAACAVGTVLIAAAFVRQVSLRRRLAADYTRALEGRARELEMFAGRVAHDIRNPLSAARMASELVLRRNDDVSLEPAIRRVSRALDRAEEITGALLQFARTGGQPAPDGRTDVSEELPDVIAGFTDEADRAEIQLETSAAPGLVASCAPGVYATVLSNLVRNALKYMGSSDPREIAVRAIAARDAVRTEVRDTGPGIKPEALPTLFEPWVRAHQGGVEGLGIGLATVKKLVEAHGGRVGVESSPGEGSTFWFELPRVPVSAELAETGVESAQLH